MMDSHLGRSLVAALLVVLLAVVPAACGKKGDLEGPKDSKYPGHYPDPAYQ